VVEQTHNNNMLAIAFDSISSCVSSTSWPGSSRRPGAQQALEDFKAQQIAMVTSIREVELHPTTPKVQYG